MEDGEKRWKQYLDARFGEMPDELDMDEDASEQEWERRAAILGAMADAMEPYTTHIPDVTAQDFAILSLGSVRPRDLDGVFRGNSRARCAPRLKPEQWQAIWDVLANHRDLIYKPESAAPEPHLFPPTDTKTPFGRNL